MGHDALRGAAGAEHQRAATLLQRRQANSRHDCAPTQNARGHARTSSVGTSSSFLESSPSTSSSSSDAPVQSPPDVRGQRSRRAGTTEHIRHANGKAVSERGEPEATAVRWDSDE